MDNPTTSERDKLASRTALSNVCVIAGAKMRCPGVQDRSLGVSAPAGSGWAVPGCGEPGGRSSPLSVRVPSPRPRFGGGRGASRPVAPVSALRPSGLRCGMRAGPPAPPCGAAWWPLIPPLRLPPSAPSPCGGRLRRSAPGFGCPAQSPRRPCGASLRWLGHRGACSARPCLGLSARGAPVVGAASPSRPPALRGGRGASGACLSASAPSCAACGGLPPPVPWAWGRPRSAPCVPVGRPALFSASPLPIWYRREPPLAVLWAACGGPSERPAAAPSSSRRGRSPPAAASLAHSRPRRFLGPALLFYCRQIGTM